MAFTFAGQMGPQATLSANDALLKSTPFIVFLPDGVTLATLYTDRTKGTTTPNPSMTDALGNFTFFAAPGQYKVTCNGTTLTVTCPVDPADVASSADPTGPAGGVLGGTYPDPTGLNGIDSVTGTPAAGGVLVATGATTAAWGDTLPAPVYELAGPWVDPDGFKVPADPDDTNSIVAAIAAAHALPGGCAVRFWRAYTISNAAPITVPSNVVFFNTGNALVTAATTGFLFDSHNDTVQVLPRIRRATRGWDTGADTTSGGVVLRNVKRSIFTIPEVELFVTGIEARGDSAGCNDNTLIIGDIIDNKINIFASVTGNAASGSNSNQFTVVGGLVHHDSGASDYTGTRGFYAPVQFTQAVGDNWFFNGTDFEGGLVERTVDMSGGENYFVACRWEVATGIWLATTSIANALWFGYAAESVPITATGSGNITISDNNGIRNVGSAGDIAIALNGTKQPGAATVSVHPTTPTPTASTTQVMAGLGSQGTPTVFTAKFTGKVRVVISGLVGTNTALASITLGGKFSTGAAPANGDAVSGTTFGNGAYSTKGAAAAVGLPFVIQDVVAVTNGTQYWFDLAFATSAGADTAFLANLSVTLEEVA